MTNFDILRSGFCTTNSEPNGPFIRIKFRTSDDMHAGFDALMALMNAEIKRIDGPEGIGGEIVNVEPVHDFGIEVTP